LVFPVIGGVALAEVRAGVPDRVLPDGCCR
jgi:hypothetical protein